MEDIIKKDAVFNKTDEEIDLEYENFSQEFLEKLFTILEKDMKYYELLRTKEVDRLLQFILALWMYDGSIKFPDTVELDSDFISSVHTKIDDSERVKEEEKVMLNRKLDDLYVSINKIICEENAIHFINSVYKTISNEAPLRKVLFKHSNLGISYLLTDIETVPIDSIPDELVALKVFAELFRRIDNDRRNAVARIKALPEIKLFVHEYMVKKINLDKANHVDNVGIFVRR